MTKSIVAACAMTLVEDGTLRPDDPVNDPAEDLIAIVFMQRAHAGDQRLPIWTDFWAAIYQAIDD